VDQKTQAQLDEYVAEQKNSDAEAPEDPATSVEALDEAAKTKIDELIANRAVSRVLDTTTATPDKEEQQKKTTRDYQAEKVEREAAREREREERRKRDEEKDFLDRERNWERREADKIKEKEREKEREDRRKKELEKKVSEGSVKPDPATVTDFATWWSKYQDKARDRRRVRDREKDEDDNDRRREKDELKAAEEKAKKEEEEENAKHNKKESAGPLSFGLGLGKRKNSAIVDDDDDDKKMKFTPIEYTEEEIAERERIAREAQPVRTPAEKEAEMKRLIATIPIAKEDLLVYPVNWGIVDRAGLVESKMRAWVSKKIADYLGEEEPMLIKYVLEMLGEHAEASAVVAKLEAVLEEEAETFVIKLWRYLIFESMRSQAGL